MEQKGQLDFKQYLRLLRKRRYLFVATAAVLITAAVTFSYFVNPVYEAKMVVSVEKNFLNDIIGKLAVAPSIDEKLNAISTLMKSRTLVDRVVSELELDLSNKTEVEREGIIKSFQNRTEIKTEFTRSGRRDVDLFTVSFKHGNPKIARDYVNMLVGKYIEENLNVKRQEAYGAQRFLMDQIGLYKGKIGKVEEEISSLKKNREIVDQDKLQELQKRLDEMRLQYTDQYPGVIRVKAEIETVKAQLRSHAGDRGFAQDTAAATEAKKRLSDLEQERDALKKIHEELASAFGKSEVSTQAEVQDKAGMFRVVDPAILPLRPVGSNRIKLMLLGLVGGVAGAFGLIVLLDFLDGSVKNADTLKNFGLPVLAVIPHIENPREVIATRRKDVLLYGFSFLFTLGYAIVVIREYLS